MMFQILCVDSFQRKMNSQCNFNDKAFLASVVSVTGRCVYSVAIFIKIVYTTDRTSVQYNPSSALVCAQYCTLLIVDWCTASTEQSYCTYRTVHYYRYTHMHKIQYTHISTLIVYLVQYSSSCTLVTMCTCVTVHPLQYTLVLLMIKRYSTL